MRLEKLSAIAEIVSSVAVLATLAYLGVQTRQNTLAIQATVRQGMLAEDRALLFQQMDYPFVIPGLFDIQTLSKEQQAQLVTWLTVFTRGRENQFLQYRNGVIDQATWESYATAIPIVFAPDFGEDFWRSYQGIFDPDFVSYVNELVAD